MSDVLHGPKILKKYTFDEDQKEIVLFPIGDLHYGNPLQSKQAINEVIKKIQDTENAYWVGCGDYFELNGKKQPHNGVFSQTLSPEDQIDAFIDDFQPIADKCLALIDGNHDFRIKKDWDISPTRFAASELGIRDKYVEDGVLVPLSFGRRTRVGGRREARGNSPCNYMIYVTHGSSSSATTTGKISALQRAGDVVVADVIVGAHVHSEVVFRDRIYIPTMNDQKQVSYRDRWYINTGSFLEYGGYALTARYRPQPMGCPEIIFDGTREKVQIKM